MQTPREETRRFNVVWLGHQVLPYIHGGLATKAKLKAPSLFRSPSYARHQGSRQVKAKRHQVTKTRPPPPSLSVTPVRFSSSSELLHQEGVSGPRTSAVPLHTKSEGPPAITKMLAAARLSIQRLLSQELTYTNSNLALMCTLSSHMWWMECSSLG